MVIRRRPPTIGELSRAAYQTQVAIQSGGRIKCDTRPIADRQAKEQYL